MSKGDKPGKMQGDIGNSKTERVSVCGCVSVSVCVSYGATNSMSGKT